MCLRLCCSLFRRDVIGYEENRRGAQWHRKLVNLSRKNSKPNNTFGHCRAAYSSKAAFVADRGFGSSQDRPLKYPFRLKIIGKKEGPYAQEVRELVEQMNLRDVVEWVGFLGVRDDIYRDLDIVVAVATDEPFGTTVLEAGAYGLPVVAPRAGGFPEMVIDGSTGILFDAGDVASLAAALEKLIVDPSLRNRLGHAGERTSPRLLR